MRQRKRKSQVSKPTSFVDDVEDQSTAQHTQTFHVYIANLLPYPLENKADPSSLSLVTSKATSAKSTSTKLVGRPPKAQAAGPAAATAAEMEADRAHFIQVDAVKPSGKRIGWKADLKTGEKFDIVVEQLGNGDEEGEKEAGEDDEGGEGEVEEVEKVEKKGKKKSAIKSGSGSGSGDKGKAKTGAGVKKSTPKKGKMAATAKGKATPAKKK